MNQATFKGNEVLSGWRTGHEAVCHGCKALQKY